ncbi:MAG: 3-hydroxyisobutyryl-CoA hydrolase [Ornithinimicrobium sp.]
MSDADQHTVHTRIDGGLGVLTLNRPKALNALDAPMISAMQEALNQWRDTADVRAVWVEGAGDRGLCAGGDVRAVREVIRAGEIDRGMEFFAHEYRLNATIAEYPKPYVAWMDGVVMGGGIGISGHGSHRLVTQGSRLAMPETIIGFVPDVGTLWLLARAPGEVGTHLALTGSTFTGADAVAIGVADHLVSSTAKAEVYDALSAAVEGAPEEDLRVWGPPEGSELSVDSPLSGQREWIDECYAGADAHTIIEKLGACQHPEARDAAALIRQRSPHSVALTLEALRRAASLSLPEVLEQDLALARTCVKHPDFDEGVRAQLVDKDRSPSWADQDVTQIKRETVLAAFAPE